MNSFLADLHIHTCLSPCAADEMIPPMIVQAAREQGLSLIAICDHNAAGNVSAVQEAARKTSGPTVIAGIEITTGEEAHVLGFFPDACAARAAADEVAAGLPTAAVLAGSDPAVVQELQQAFSDRFFRFYSAGDVVGVELAGALKNVIAIAAGMATGLQLGLNAMAALLTRGLHEIARLGVRLGGREETFRGLAGMGDLVLTCTGALSRNRSVGERLGRGEPLATIIAGREVAEGVPTARAASELARRNGVEMPITFTVEAILAGRLSPRAAVPALMTRELKEEALL